jgi:hypothetical protein
MELPDLTTAQTIHIFAMTAIAVLGVVFGWFRKAWRFATAIWNRVRRAQPALVLFENSLRGSYWNSATMSGKSALQVTINPEVSNVTDGAHRIMGARIAWWRRPSVTHIGVQDIQSGKHGHDHPLPPHQVVPTFVHFLFDRRPPSKQDKVLKATLVITNHQRADYRLRVSLKGPKVRA